jgi:hypothetical protein
LAAFSGKGTCFNRDSTIWSTFFVRSRRLGVEQIRAQIDTIRPDRLTASLPTKVIRVDTTRPPWRRSYDKVAMSGEEMVALFGSIG